MNSVSGETYSTFAGNGALVVSTRTVAGAPSFTPSRLPSGTNTSTYGCVVSARVTAGEPTTANSPPFTSTSTTSASAFAPSV